MNPAGEKLCLWNGRALFIGRVPDLGFHQQAAALVCVGLDGDFEITREGDDSIKCGSALVAPQVYHAIKPGDSRCAFLFFDPDNPDFDFLTTSNAGEGMTGILVALKEEEKLRSVFMAILGCEDESRLSALLADLELSPQRPGVIEDERIQLVMRRLVSDPGESIPVESLAAEVGLSPSRLAHLFKEQVGVPIRMFRTWYRLKTAVVNLRDGMTLTDAALRAGFYDSAHFTNAFRETFGLPPSLVFGGHRKIQWHIGDTLFASLS